jgi:hypothetical protein
VTIRKTDKYQSNPKGLALVVSNPGFEMKKQKTKKINKNKNRERLGC